MAQAVLEQYPEARLAIGPPTADGFYYDFDLAKDQNGQPETFKPEDLKELEKRMRQIIGEQHPFIYREVTMEEARDLFQDQTYKLELIAGLAEGKIDEYRNIRNHPAIISTYQQDFFEDLYGDPTWPIQAWCRPMVESSCLLPVHIGAATKKIRCCNGFTVRPGQIARTFKFIYKC